MGMNSKVNKFLLDLRAYLLDLLFSVNPHNMFMCLNNLIEKLFFVHFLLKPLWIWHRNLEQISLEMFFRLLLIQAFFQTVLQVQAKVFNFFEQLTAPTMKIKCSCLQICD